MEERVAFGHVVGVGAGRVDGGVVRLKIGDVEEVGRREAMRFVHLCGIGRAVVEGAEASGEGHVRSVRESRAAENEDAILDKNKKRQLALNSM